MAVVVRILIAVAILIAIPLLGALFVRKTFTVEREVTINKSKPDVFHYLKHLKNHESFTKWAALDPNMKKDYRGEDGTVGFVAVWQSENKEVGKSQQEIKQIVEGERIEYEIRFTEPFQSTDPAYVTTEAVAGNRTKVKWGYHGKMAYPTNLMIPFIKGRIGKDIDTGLANLKAILEKQ